MIAYGKRGAFKRGQIIDKALGNNLGYNFPVVDKLNDRTITSIKSMDLNANTYQTGRGIYNALVKNIDTLDNFAERRWQGTIVSKNITIKKNWKLLFQK